MINIKYNNEDNIINNKLSELSINQYEKITEIINTKGKEFIDKWIDILIYLGLSEEIIDTFSVEDFVKIIQTFSLEENKPTNEIFKTIILNGKEYNSFDEIFKITVKEMAMIETVIKKNEHKYLGEVLAILYKSPDSDRTINYDKEHIKYKAKLIREQVTADIAIPILNHIGKIMIENFKHLENE